ncbi:MAG TPA: HepT-like ribonuclease domain-containing protein [Thermoplasmata archaeon]|nr:HepT-like ribonuclease domain-containing protein [Thermoplasmata archaeon]
MIDAADRSEVYLVLAVEHLRNALQYAERGRRVFFDEGTPDTYLLVEGELRKAFESLNRLGRPFWKANPMVPRDRIGEIRQLLTHDYVDVDPALVWGVVTKEARPLLRRLARAKAPRSA